MLSLNFKWAIFISFQLKVEKKILFNKNVNVFYSFLFFLLPNCLNKKNVNFLKMFLPLPPSLITKHIVHVVWVSVGGFLIMYKERKCFLGLQGLQTKK